MIQPYFNELVGRGSFFAELVEFVRRCSASSDPALISGETGTGKEAAARSIHLSSNRKNHPFLVVDCSLYYERELERELFGDEMGGDASVRKGILEFSTKGTCYLANIEELSPSIQERLYNYLATGYLQRVGSDRPVSSRVRIIVSSDKDLRGFAEGGLFSAELFGCLEGLQLKTIPLRRHPEDIRPFTRHLLKLYSLEHSGTGARADFDIDSWEALESYPWPGNYDELKRELLRLFRSGASLITPEILSPEISHYWMGRRGEPEIRKVVEEIEEYIQEFKLMVRLDGEYGSGLLGMEDWCLQLKYHCRV